MCYGCLDLAADLLVTAELIKEKIPADRNWLDEGSPFQEYDDVPATPVDYSQHNNEPSGDWYHVAPRSLKPGTKLVPGGGSGLHDTAPSEWGSDSGMGNRRNHVWLAPNIDKALFWQSQFGPGARIHHVKPGAKPQRWNMTGSEGWVVPHAHIIQDITDDPALRALKTAMADTAPWHPGIVHKVHPNNTGDPENVQGTYVAHEPGGGAVGVLDYWRHTFGGPTIKVDNVSVHPKYQGQGVAQALVERMHADHPQHQIDPGRTTDQGGGFTQRMLDSTPNADSVISPHWERKPLNDNAREVYKREQENFWT